MTRINYKSDFDFILRLVDADGNVLPFPDFDWQATLYTTVRANGYTFGCTDGQCTRCYNDNGLIHVIADSHRLSPGFLNVEFRSDLLDSIFPDGRRLTVTPLPLDIELVRTQADIPSAVETEALAPYALVTACDLARREGYTGSEADYAAALAAMPQAVATAQATAEAYVRDHEALGTLIEKCETLGEDIAEGYRAEKASLDSKVEQWQGEVEGMQPRLSSSATIAVNPDSTLSTTEAAEKAMFIKMWNTRCTYYYENGPLVAGRYNPDTGFFELNGLTDITYEQALAIYARPVDVSSEMYYFYNAGIRTHLPPYMQRSNYTYAIGKNFFHTTNMESIFLPGCIASGYWDNYKLKRLTLTGIKEARVLQYKPLLERFRWSGAGNMSVTYRPRISLYVEGSPNLDYESYNQLITGQWDGTNAITLRVCAAAYAKITGDTTVAEAAALTEEEAEQWQSLADKAAAKNIVLAKG